MEFAYFGISILICIVLDSTKDVSSAKVPLRPVYEKTGENIDLYGNPLAGSSPAHLQRRARAHARDQRRRFDSEKDRMQRAQRQRFTENGGETMDSYVRAHKEQQESFHREMENKQAKDVKGAASQYRGNNIAVITREGEALATVDKTQKRTLKDFPNAQWWKNSQIRQKRVNINSVASVTEHAREERSHSARSPYVLGQNYFLPMQGAASPAYSQLFSPTPASPGARDRVIVPHFSPSQNFNTDDISSLTSAALSDDQAQGQFSQLSGYKSVQDIQSLSALLGKGPDDQLQGLNRLLHDIPNHKVTNEEFKNSHINIKASSLDIPKEEYKKYDYFAPYPSSDRPQFTYSYNDEGQRQFKDHTPITENVQDVADTRRPPVHIGTVEQFYPTEAPLSHSSSTSYYKVEVSNKIVTETPRTDEYSLTDSGSSSFSSGRNNLQYASQYEFGYRVKDPHSGNDFGHSESSDGESASGSYHVLLPDGRLQRVRYRAGPQGYQAHVSYH